jgi:hypothetical protein
MSDDNVIRQTHITKNTADAQATSVAEQINECDYAEQYGLSGAAINDTGGEFLTEEFLAVLEDHVISNDKFNDFAIKSKSKDEQERERFEKRYANKEAPFAEVEAAVEVIPNNDVFLEELTGWASWEAWNSLGMAIYAATGGSDDGFKLFDKWSLKHRSYNATDTEEKWKTFKRSPPREIGAGSLFFWADKADPKWREDYRKKNRPLPVVFDAGDDLKLPPAREWLLGNIFCRRFLSSLFGDGGVGKTALRYAQYLSLATGRSLTGEYVFQRCRVLIVSFEDDIEELRRRIWAIRLHYGISQEELKGWLFYWSARAGDGKLMILDRFGNPKVGDLKDHMEALIVQHNLDLIGIDPFIKSHGVGENNNVAIDMVAQVLTDMCTEFNIAVDIPHHVSKKAVGDREPGDANSGRGASALKDAARLVYTLNVMAKEEAEKFGINEEDRHSYVRMDKGKVNITPPSRKAMWFKLIGVSIGNSNEIYPSGDEVQVAQSWTPPDVMFGLSNAQVAKILNIIGEGMENGSRYTHVGSAKSRAAWKVVVDVEPKLNQKQAGEVIKTWMKEKVLVSKPYQNPQTYKEEEGLWQNGVDKDVPF